MNLQTGDLALVYMPFGWRKGGKVRPVLVVDINDEYVECYAITSQYEKKSAKIRSHYFPIKSFKKVGLDKQSYVDTVKTYKVSRQSSHFKRIGYFNHKLLQRLVEFIG